MSQLGLALDQPCPSGLAALGETWDAAVFDACRQFHSLDVDSKAAVRRGMTRGRSQAVVGWAEGLATLGVREANRDRLIYALVGLSLFNGDEIDERDALVVLHIVGRAAVILGESPVKLAAEAAGRTDSVGGIWLTARMPAAPQTPPTHNEVGSGAQFSFRRAHTSNPEVELAHLLEDPDTGTFPRARDDEAT